MIPGAAYAYFLDIDGTLIDFADAPSAVKVDPALPGLVDALYRSSGGAVALVTGRSIADVDRLFPSRRLPAAGQHGLERRTAQGRTSARPGSPGSLDGARQVLASVAARHPELLVEDKGLSLALHYRTAPRLAGLAHRVIRSLHQRLGPRYCVHRGKRVVELALAGRDKGAAIRAFMREAPFRGRTPAFIGDDVTDEYGFKVVNQLGGLSIKVGPGPTAAAWRLSNVRAVTKWLEHGKPAPRRVPERRR